MPEGRSSVSRRGGGARTTKRRGRLQVGARAVLADLAPQWAIPAPLPWPTALLDDTFGRRAPRLLDIGFGNGVATRAWARSHDDCDVIATDLHRPGLARLVRDLHGEGPVNVRVVELDALVLVDGLSPGGIQEVRILFPDPWPKRRHQRRRMVDAVFTGQLADLLPVGGTLHVATDSLDYARQVRAAIAEDPRLAAQPLDVGETWTSARPDRPVTPYERRALDAGRRVTDLVAERIAPAPSA